MLSRFVSYAVSEYGLTAVGDLLTSEYQHDGCQKYEGTGAGRSSLTYISEFP